MSKFASAKVSFTRPANTTTYASGDTLNTAAGAALEFPFAARNEPASINNAWLISSSNPTLKGLFELWLFSVAPAAVADNAAVAITDAEMANFLGIIPFSIAYVGNAGADAAGNCVYPADLTIKNLNIQIGGTSIFGKLVARNAYVPVDSEIFTIILNLIQN